MTILFTYAIITIDKEKEREDFKMKRLTFAECPKTRSAFVQKWNSDRVFKARAQYTGFEVLCGTIVRLPNGMIAGATVK